MEMEIEDTIEEYPFFADMERRRIAALEKFYLNNPDYKVTDLQQSGDQIGGLKSVTPLEIKQSRVSSNNDKRWTLETTLELLEAMKVYARANNFARMGKSMEKWEAVANTLSNPLGLDLNILARSSMNKLAEIRRLHKRGGLEIEIQRSLIDFDQNWKFDI
ncbi:unnamed protein product [Calypogeia fissa]